ncbi:MAG: 2-oxoglutarate dehydrogenase E1 component [Dehalococcoidia bacterium]|nr:2-oxoglutarate dehydrogenase E1 component [Dehalococcoidia bacterium]MSQ35061.1 2-oxoglutarate dehydrogenase E1 component [Dehalococcoidia bacterium]
MTSERARENGHKGAAHSNEFGGMNSGYVADLIERYRQDPSSVPAEDRGLIGLQSVEAITVGETTIAPAVAGASGVDIRRLSRLLSYIEAIRAYGYRAANLDPLGLRSRREPLVESVAHGVTEADLASPAAQAVMVAGGSGALKFGATAGELVANLRDVYCGTVGYEFSHIRSPEERAWLRNAVESGRYSPFVTPEQKTKILDLLTRAEVFEQFLHKAFPAQRWFSLEGCEALVILTDQVILHAAYSGIRNIVVGMAHRGRLNLLTHIFGKPCEQVFAEFMHGQYVQEGDLHGDSGYMTDVKYHMGARTALDLDGDGVADTALILLPNPSHLEMVNPVVAGGVRALQDAAGITPQGRSTLRPDGRSRTEDVAMGLLIHGDAAFAGQGIVPESLNMAGLDGYRTGGSLHIILNNQLGFTTDPRDSHSTEHASDVARGYGIPVVHMNADDIGACVSVAKLALAYRQRFGKDFLIDLVGYRRFGHNENDDPSYTQPVMYRAIETHPTARSIYQATLVREKTVDPGLPAKLAEEYATKLRALKDSVTSLMANGQHSNGNGHAPEKMPAAVKTAVPVNILSDVNSKLTAFPRGFIPHPRLSKIIERKQEIFDSGQGIDWALAESLAIGTVLLEGVPVRLVGQDTERGTFSHRHAVLRDSVTGEPYTPLAALGGAPFHIYNTPLSEQAALAFEHGYSVFADNTLTIWEAQFGDFVNSAQAIVDELIVSGHAKWGQRSGLVLLLPHGYEGQGANHSNAHLDRFLALAAGDDIRVVYPTTASQYFHLLRQQASELKTCPRPLVVMAPKSLLRHPLAASTVPELTGGAFRPVITETVNSANATGVDRLILCTGKVFADLASSEEYTRAKGVAIVRIEQLYPFPKGQLGSEIARFTNVKHTVWLQEEPQNRGAWAFVSPLLRELLGHDQPFTYVGRPAMPSPSEGAHWRHKVVQDRLVRRALGAAE